jgi:hypothetical protein
MKKKTHTQELVKLIDGTFDAQEAKEILISLLSHKINFHNIKNLSWGEHFGRSNQQSIVRIEELRKDRERISEVLDVASKNNHKVNIHSTIEIQVTK